MEGQEADGEIKMKKELLRELHPAVSMFYFIMLLIIIMFSLNPMVITASFVISIISVLRHKGFKTLKTMILFFIPVFLFSAIVLPFFNHNGITALFYVNDMAVTLENIVYGLIMTMLLMGVSLYFVTAGCMINSEKILYITNKISHKLSLIISMVLRFIPMMIRRWHEIHEAQLGMLCAQGIGFMAKAKQYSKEISILISWCLENSIDTSISMESRGYGTGKRSSYHKFRLKKTDVIFLILFTVLSLCIVYTFIMGKFETYYFPEIYIRKMDKVSSTAFIFQIIYMSFALL